MKKKRLPKYCPLPDSVPTVDGGYKLPDPGGVVYLGEFGWAAKGYVRNENRTYSPVFEDNK